MLPKMNLTYLFPLSRNKACQVIRKTGIMTEIGSYVLMMEVHGDLEKSFILDFLESGKDQNLFIKKIFLILNHL